MDVVVRGRRTEVTDRFRQHVVEKVSRIERLDHKVMRIDVEVLHEPNPRLSRVCERVELTCVSRGPVVRAEAAADDAYAALDLAVAKLEERLRRAADRRRVHHGTRTPVGLAEAAASAVTPAAVAVLDGIGPDGAAVDGAAPAGTESPDGGDDPGLVVREKDHHAPPMTVEEALHSMELVGHDFFLFRDSASGRPSVVYRRRGYAYGVLRLAE